MTHERRMRRAAGFVLAALLLAPGTAPLLAGDEDERPAYLIYLDPETGKYTTEDPAARESDPSRVAESAAVTRANADTPPVRSSGPGRVLIAGGVVGALALLVAVALRRYLPVRPKNPHPAERRRYGPASQRSAATRPPASSRGRSMWP